MSDAPDQYPYDFEGQRIPAGRVKFSGTSDAPEVLTYGDLVIIVAVGSITGVDHTTHGKRMARVQRVSVDETFVLGSGDDADVDELIRSLRKQRREAEDAREGRVELPLDTVVVEVAGGPWPGDPDDDPDDSDDSGDSGDDDPDPEATALLDYADDETGDDPDPAA